jgi:hypothetical protein
MINHLFHPLQSYALALLNLMAWQENVISKPALGTARHLGAVRLSTCQLTKTPPSSDPVFPVSVNASSP